MWWFVGYSRNDHIHFILLIRAIQLASMGLMKSVVTLSFLPEPFPAHVGHAKGRDRHHHLIGQQIPPSTATHLPKSQPRCLAEAGVVSPLLFHHQAFKMAI